MRERRQPIKPKFRVFAEVSELGIGSRFAKSRGRLLGFSIGLTALFVTYSVFSSNYMRTGASSTGLNLILISLAMLFILVVTYFQSLMAGDLCFPGPWRERVILGQKQELDSEEALLSGISKFKDFTLAFYLVFIVLLAFNYLAYGWVTGGFLSEYQEWGYQYTLLQDEDPDSRIRGVRNIVHPLRYEAQQEDTIRQAMIVLLDDPDDEVKAWTLWAIRELNVYSARPRLREMVVDADLSDVIRADVAEALGQLADVEGARLMAELLADSVGRDELALGLLRGLGLARVETTAPFISPFLSVTPVDVRSHAFWALAMTGNTDYRSAMIELIEEGDELERCLAAEAMKFLAEPEDLVTAHAWFAAGSDVMCTGVVWTEPYHWDEGYQFHREIIIEESLQAKFLKIVFTAGGVNQREFFLELATDPRQSGEIQMLARELARRIRDRH